MRGRRFDRLVSPGILSINSATWRAALTAKEQQHLTDRRFGDRRISPVASITLVVSNSMRIPPSVIEA